MKPQVGESRNGGFGESTSSGKRLQALPALGIITRKYTYIPMPSPLRFVIDRSAVDERLAALPEQIVKAAQEGMYEGMTGFAKLVASRVHSRTGDLARAIENSARIRDNGTQVTGTISPRNSKGLPIGLWIEEGISEPATDKLLAFAGAGRGEGFSRGHKAFKIPAHPFINPSMDEFQGEIIEKIRAQIEAAVDLNA